MKEAATEGEAARLLGEIGAHEHHGGADHARRERQANRVVVGGPAAAAFLVEVVVRPGQAQVVGKEPHQGRELGDRDDAEDARADQDAIGEHREVEGALLGHSIYGPIGIVMAEVFTTFPHALLIILAALALADARLYEAATALRASRPRIFWTVTLPGAR
ncbi:MAG: hypothetical protein DMD99_21870 [Candidatus Rokuibacteriota bacterium]|nr:MAG: hypothetical protein DMD99_21870 [Candidatus Rokubacteria bacterium]